jgi:hypothetical protein
LRRVAFVTGLTGQDRSSLAEFLLAKGDQVHGLIRRASTFNTGRINVRGPQTADSSPVCGSHLTPRHTGSPTRRKLWPYLCARRRSVGRVTSGHRFRSRAGTKVLARGLGTGRPRQGDSLQLDL